MENVVIELPQKVAELTEKYQRRVQASPEEALEFLTTSANALVKTRKRAFEEMLRELNILDYWKDLNEQFENFAVFLQDIQISGSNVSISLNDGKILEHKILKVEDFLEQSLKVPKDNSNYILLLGFFSYPERYQLIQVLNTADLL